MHEIMVALVELQKLEFGPDADAPAKQSSIEKLRAKVPPQVLGHYDRLLARGKKGLSLVRNQVCAECHVSVPLGTVITIMKGLDIQLCGNCGRYLFIEDTPPPTEPPPAPPKAKRGRKPKNPQPPAKG